MIWHVHDRTGAAYTVREQVEPDDEPGLLALFDACEAWFVEALALPSAPSNVQLTRLRDLRRARSAPQGQPRHPRG